MDSFGERLKREREKRGVTLDDVSAATKIGTRMLRALEEEKFDQLPGGIFNKGFVRAYAQQLGLDEDQAVADYLAASGQTQPERLPESALTSFPLEIRDEMHPSPAAQIPWGWLALGLLVVALGSALWSVRARKSVPELPAEAAPTAPPSNPAASAPKTPVQPGSPVVAPAGTAVMSTQPSRSFTVTIKANADSWIAVTVDGKQVMQDTLVSPAEKTLTAQKEITIKAGNIGALQLSFNGRVLPAQGDLAEVKTITFTPRGVQPVPPLN